MTVSNNNLFPLIDDTLAIKGDIIRNIFVCEK